MLAFDKTDVMFRRGVLLYVKRRVLKTAFDASQGVLSLSCGFGLPCVRRSYSGILPVIGRWPYIPTGT